MKKGNLSINSENIFPIIKKWLYSDHDIFVRELISNATDAITKLKKLSLAGEFTKPEGEEYKINVEVSPKQKLIRFIDNGIGMTEEEVEKYINQIAFSGAVDFIEKYKDKTNEEQIIGHFGLGFYSAFMVADKVSIDTLSYKEGAKPIHWVSDGGLEFEMGEGNRASRGTAITLYLNDNCHEFANEFRVREILNKYCSFMPVEIFLKDIDAEEATEIIEKDELLESDTVIETIIEPAKTEEKEKEDGTKEEVEVEPAKEKIKIKKRPVALNDIHPLWTKHPNECSDEEYIEFYRKVFMDYKEPLFWIHLNMDYPFNLKGILYFPKINTEYDSIEGTIKLYNNQVFIADNIKEVIPEFLLLLKGVIDSADIPLNVSRSALQNDGSVRKISEYIAKKVADKLSGMCKTERDKYEKYWDDIAPFIKYGYLKDEKFGKKVEDYILFKNINDKYLTLNELVDESKNSEDKLENSSDETQENSEEKKEVEKTQIFYVNDVKEQSQYVNIFKSAGKDAVVLPHSIDVPFISTLEMKRDNVKFLRIDSDMTDDMRSEEVAEDSKASYDALSEKVKTALHNDRLKVSVQPLKSDEISSVITISEESRRMQEMMKQYGMMGMDPSMFGGEGETLVLNANHPLVKELLENSHEECFDMICEHLYDMASISHSPLSPERMSAFIKRSNELMLKLK
ncbi:molecular chaperone HtpG [Lachnoanaerobaculum umeaense]|uniref:Molecular chaperone HtpG n=1 Tax=Lachnoanaerobaculum umeaense TaxID=617123 RepID=A0A385PZ54_9FIRM|nr:molecular chaperone HtpG [Lachnoanaerobaculum umeaense]AYA99282.1 molecular chaperone HtpG [Lachnoanaerobaculum umeaense]PZW94304.1 molecular chaperone HtpG [Lachnoanaerobaculum umeaense]